MSIRAAPRRCVARPLFMLALMGPLLGFGPPPANPTSNPASNPPGAPQDPGAAPQRDPFAEPPPRDPDDAPFLPPPNNQIGQWSAGRRAPLTRGFDDDHWVQLTAAPTYAAIHAPLIGRGSTPLRGGGVALELDLRLLPWLFLRAYGSHTLHPAFSETSFDEDSGETTLTANEGIVHATNIGGSIVYALDIGRFVPRVDVGAGAMFVRSPAAAQAGQWGGECLQNGGCDLGLSCNAEEICRPTPVPEVHIGVGFDVLLGRRFALGLGLRYYALLSALESLPFYLHGSARLSLRF